jgi:hypothetical protein
VTSRLTSRVVALGLGLAMLAGPGVSWAQRRGGGGGPAAPAADNRTRLEILTDALKLDG